MSSAQERQRELDDLKKSLDDLFKRDNAKMKADLILHFRSEVDLSWRLAREGNLEGAALHSEIAQSIMEYLNKLT